MADEDWFQEHASEMKARLGSSQMQVTLESLQDALCRTAAWKAPGFDGVFGFFVKKVTALHDLVKVFTKILNDELTHPFPACFSTGRTDLKPNYRKKHLIADDNAIPFNCQPT
jgi:hypothetical protein